MGHFCLYRKCENWTCCTVDTDFDLGIYYALSKRPLLYKDDIRVFILCFAIPVAHCTNHIQRVEFMKHTMQQLTLLAMFQTKDWLGLHESFSPVKLWYFFMMDYVMLVVHDANNYWTVCKVYKLCHNNNNNWCLQGLLPNYGRKIQYLVFEMFCYIFSYMYSTLQL